MMIEFDSEDRRLACEARARLGRGLASARRQSTFIAVGTGSDDLRVSFDQAVKLGEATVLKSLPPARRMTAPPSSRLPT
jgi:hypothetical protein